MSVRPKPGFNWTLVNWEGPDETPRDQCSYCEAPIPEDFVPLILWNDQKWAARFCGRCMEVWWGFAPDVQTYLSGVHPMIPKDAISTLPTIIGPKGRAWRLNMRAPALRQEHCGIDTWLVEAAWAHPMWHSYLISLIHMRPLPGNPPPIVHLEGATHELVVFALHPDSKRQKIIETSDCMYGRMMSPINFAAQFIEVADDLAQTRVYAAVTSIVNGQLSPDTDFMRNWIALFGDNMLKDKRRNVR